MLKYRGARIARAGFIGAILCALVVLVGLSPQQLLSHATSIRYQAAFVDAAGLTVGNNVTVSGVKAGHVTAITLRGKDAVVTFAVNAGIALGAQTTAHIRTGTLLGQRVLTLESAGTPTLKPMALIPRERTFAPYSLTDALSEFAGNTADTDTQELSQSLDTLSETLDAVAPQLGPTFDGITRLSRAYNERGDALSELLRNADDVTTILAERSDQLSTLILNANDLTGVLAQRRWVIMELLTHTSAVAQEVTGLVHDNEAELAPTLEKLNSVLAMLERNRDTIAETLPRLAKYQITLGETVSSGPYYSAYIPNLDLPPVLQPFFDYAFGFRRGTNAGQPPDNAGPRAELPIPYNAIPEHPQ